MKYGTVHDVTVTEPRSGTVVAKAETAYVRIDSWEVFVGGKFSVKNDNTLRLFLNKFRISWAMGSLGTKEFAEMILQDTPKDREQVAFDIDDMPDASDAWEVFCNERMPNGENSFLRWNERYRDFANDPGLRKMF